MTSKLKLKSYLGIDQDDIYLWEKLESTGIFSEELIGLDKDATPAQLLQCILEKKWSLKESDRDMIVMWHNVTYLKNGEAHGVKSSLVCEGQDRQHTAMAQTVGLPLAIGCKLILTNQISDRGCLLPIKPEFYTPILKELEEYSIVFKEKRL